MTEKTHKVQTQDSNFLVWDKLFSKLAWKFKPTKSGDMFLDAEAVYNELKNEFNLTLKSEQTENTLNLVLNDIKNTPEDVFNNQWESIKKKIKKPLKDSNPITKYLKSE